MGKENKGKGHG